MTRRLSALAAVLALALVTGCGSDKKTIPHDEGSSLIRQLRNVRDFAGDPKKCPQLLNAVQDVQDRVASLPARVDKDTRDSLVNGVNNLIDETRSDCANAQTTPTTETTPTAPPETTPTAPPETTPTAPPETTPTAPPETTPTNPGNGGVTPGNPPEVPPGQEKKDKKPKGGKQ